MKTACSICSLALGVLLGTAVAGGVFLAAPARAANLITLASFNGANGRNPASGLIADANGNLYGTTENGGANNLGTIFKINSATGVLAALASFNVTNGLHPRAGLIADVDGNLYGATPEGGGPGYGSVFKFASATGALTMLASFNGANGRFPLGNLIADANGNLYGTTFYGGTSGSGTVFKFDPDAGALTALASFDGANGSNAGAGLIADADGNLYGTTVYGGTSDRGTVFKVNPATGAIATVASFNSASGSGPRAGLIADAAGNLYGTTYSGGASSHGTVFKFTPATGDLAALASFNNANGRIPLGNLISDADGNLYGTTSHGGGSDNGTVFKLDPTTGVITTLASFNGANGSSPFAGLIADAAGNLYGTTVSGGPSNYGTVFKLTDTGFVVPVVPEPASLSLLALGGVAMVRRPA